MMKDEVKDIAMYEFLRYENNITIEHRIIEYNPVFCILMGYASVVGSFK